MEEFIIYLEENLELAESIFKEYYVEQAQIEGETMQNDEFIGESCIEDMENIELYEQYAHTTGHSAHHEGARGVIQELGVLSGFDVEIDDEEIRHEIIIMLGKEY